MVRTSGEFGSDGEMMTTDFPVLSVAIWLPILAGVAMILADRAGSARTLRWAALAASVAGFLSPNPGGVGPMTRAMLVRNVVLASQN